MDLKLTEELQQALTARNDAPLRLIHPQTGQAYVLIRESAFSQALLSDELADTYPAQIESALKAGWDDPVLDEYNDYDRHRRR